MNLNKFGYLLFIAGCILLIASGCSKKGARLRLPKPKEEIVYPAPPDSARIQFLCSFSTSRNISGSSSSFKRFIIGESTPKQVGKPYGICGRNGKIYICDDAVNGIDIFDLEKNKFSYFTPRGLGAFQTPVNIYVNENDYLYVADPKRQQVLIFNNKREYITAIGGDENFRPTDVFVQENKIYITDSKHNKINVYNKEGYSLLNSIPESAEEGREDWLFQPLNIYIRDDKIYVSDFGDFKIKIYGLDGKFIKSVGSYGTNIGQFARPKGVAVDKQGNIFVVDAAYENTQIFDKDGRLLLYFGGPYKGPGDMWLPAKASIDYDNIKYFESYTDANYELKYLIYVTNQYGPDKVNIYGAIKPKKKIK